MEKLELDNKFENLERLHKTKKSHIINLIFQCLLMVLSITSLVLGFITNDELIIALMSVLSGIMIFAVICEATSLVALKKRIIELTDEVIAECQKIENEIRESIRNEIHKTMMSIFAETNKPQKKKSQPKKVGTQKGAEPKTKKATTKKKN